MVRLVSLICSLILLDALAFAEEKPDPQKVKTTLVLRYTFTRDKKGQVLDSSGNGLHGKLSKGKVLEDDGEPTLELAGEGHVSVKSSAKLNPAHKPLVIGGRCLPSAPGGVIAAYGGENQGFSLYIKNGVPTFAVRSSGKRTLVRAEDRVPVGRWVHLMGVLDAGGRLRIYVNGKRSESVQGALLTAQPKDDLSIGADTGSWVGDYKDDHYWTGQLKDVRLYWGRPTEAEVNKWMKAPE